MNIIDEIRETLRDDDTVQDCIDAYNAGDENVTMAEAMRAVLAVVERKLLGEDQLVASSPILQPRST